MKTKYIKVSNLRKKVKSKNCSISENAIMELDRLIELAVNRAVASIDKGRINGCLVRLVTDRE